ncbi:MAG: nuclear transport factor 2 family protein [Candidatus Binataceae bacterium]
MDTAQEKERALNFLRQLEKPDPKVLGDLISDNFEFEVMGRLPGFGVLRGKDTFIKQFGETIKTMFPKGLNIKFHTVIAEGPHVAIQCESDTTAANGKKYANRYHFYIRFDGDRIAQVREYNDTNHVREVFMS